MLRLSLVVRIAVAGVLMSSGTIYGQAGGACGVGGGGTGGGAGAGTGAGAAGTGIAGAGAAGAGRPGIGGSVAGPGISNFGLLNQLAQVDQAQQQIQEAAALAARETQLQNSTERFMRMALTFDDNNDRQFDREELNKVAAAVIAELRTRQSQAQTRQTRRRSRGNRGMQRSDDGDSETTRTMQETFVARAMSFDRDEDGVLDSFESRRMVRALLLSLS